MNGNACFSDSVESFEDEPESVSNDKFTLHFLVSSGGGSHHGDPPADFSA